MFRLHPYPKSKPRAPVNEPLKGRRNEGGGACDVRRAKHALSGFPEPDLYQDVDLASTLGNVAPSRRGQD